MLAQAVSTFAITNKDKPLNSKVMNTDNTFDCINAMFSTESSYMTLVDMINEMDLEVTDIRFC